MNRYILQDFVIKEALPLEIHSIAYEASKPVFQFFIVRVEIVPIF